MLPQHLGTLHAYEQVLALVLAFGPFVVLAIVILVRRRQDTARGAVEDTLGDALGDTAGDTGRDD